MKANTAAKWMEVRVNRYMGVPTLKRESAGPALLPADWYAMNTAAKAQGEFWSCLLLGR